MKTIEEVLFMAVERGGFENMPSILLGTTFAAHYFHDVVDTGQAHNIRLSQFVSFIDTSKILAKTMKGT